MPKPANSTIANLSFEAQLWAAAYALRSYMDAAKFRHIFLGLIFLKYISDALEVKLTDFVAQLQEQMSQARTLRSAVTRNLKEIGYGLPEQ